jgi:hypothetical protein
MTQFVVTSCRLHKIGDFQPQQPGILPFSSSQSLDMYPFPRFIKVFHALGAPGTPLQAGQSVPTIIAVV